MKWIRFFRRAKTACPVPSDVVFFDWTGYEVFGESALKGFTHIAVPCRQEEYWIAPKIIVGAFAVLPGIFLRRRELRITGREAITVSYQAAILGAIKPKVVVTFIDNATLFQALSSYFSSIPFVAVQNGTRWYSSYLQMRAPVRFKYLLCFGRFEEQLLGLMGATVDHCYPVGSAKLGLHDVHAIKSRKSDIKICFVSQLRPIFLTGADSQSNGKAMKLLCEYLADFIASTGATMKIALVGNESWEVDFYQSYFGKLPSVSLVPNTTRGTTSYETAASAEVIVGHYSTLLTEMFGIGKKVLFCNAGPCSLHDMPFDYDFALRRPSKQQFQSKLTELLAFDHDEYRSRYRELQGFLMSQDEKLSPTKVLAELINSLVAGQK